MSAPACRAGIVSVSANTAMLGLSGFRLLAVSEGDGELEQVIETSASTAWWVGCGVQAVAHGRRDLRRGLALITDRQSDAARARGFSYRRGRARHQR